MTLPPQREVQRLWDSCGHAATDPYAWRYLRCRRRLSVVEVALQDLARVLPRDAACPRWARCGQQSWAASGHRLIVPIYQTWDCRRPALLRAWSWDPGAWCSRLSASSCDGCYQVVRCLVMANRPGREMLRWAGLWGPALRGLVIVEGEPDYLTAAVAWPQWAVLGIVGGAWSEEIAATVPRGATVVVRTDSDTAGDRMAAQVTETLRGRATVRRVRDELDVNDLLRAGVLAGDPRVGRLEGLTVAHMSDTGTCHER